MYIYFYTEKQIIVPVDFLVSCVAPLIPELTVQLWYVIVRVGVCDANAYVPPKYFDCIFTGDA